MNGFLKGGNALAARLFDYVGVAGYADIADDLRQAAPIASSLASLLLQDGIY